MQGSRIMISGDKENVKIFVSDRLLIFYLVLDCHNSTQCSTFNTLFMCLVVSNLNIK